MIRDPRVFPDPKALTRAVADESLAVIEAAVRARGRATVCLSGGRTPKSLNQLWAAEYATKMPWNQIHLFWGDERYVPPDDPASNFRMVRESLLDRVPIPAANVHPMRTNFERPDDAAKDYERELKQFFGMGIGTGSEQPDPQFDLIFLGLGPEGHTASLFPGSPALLEKQRWVVSANVPAEPPTRLTLTYPVLNRGANVFFLVEGAEKRQIIQFLREDQETDKSPYPALRVQPAGRLIWFMDSAAAGQ
jgi:6-phosphogluconolactonase